MLACATHSLAKPDPLGETNERMSRFLTAHQQQLGYTVPSMLVHAGKYRTEDKLKIQPVQKLNTTQKTKLPWFSRYDSWLGNEMGLFYNAPEPTHEIANCYNTKALKADAHLHKDNQLSTCGGSRQVMCRTEHR